MPRASGEVGATLECVNRPSIGSVSTSSLDLSQVYPIGDDGMAQA